MLVLSESFGTTSCVYVCGVEGDQIVCLSFDKGTTQLVFMELYLLQRFRYPLIGTNHTGIRGLKTEAALPFFFFFFSPANASDL